MESLTEEELAVKCKSLVRGSAFKVWAMGVPDNVELDDLIQIGYLQLIRLRREYEPELKVPLKAFLAGHLYLRIIDEVRSLRWVKRSQNKYHAPANFTVDSLDDFLDTLAEDCPKSLWHWDGDEWAEDRKTVLDFLDWFSLQNRAAAKHVRYVVTEQITAAEASRRTGVSESAYSWSLRCALSAAADYAELIRTE